MSVTLDLSQADWTWIGGTGHKLVEHGLALEWSQRYKQFISSKRVTEASTISDWKKTDAEKFIKP